MKMELPADMQNLIGPEERIELYVDGEKYPEITSDTVALTNERVILRRHNLEGTGAAITAYSYREITGVGMEKGFMRSIIRLRIKTAEETMDAIRLPTKQAEQAIGILKNKVCGITSPF
ncbi:MAG TPA: PH domain-containing protein [Methanomassiliicoccales archaeon]|jgi:hypothetical protein